MRRVAVLGGVRIPFCRSHTAYAELSNLDMLTASLTGLIDRFSLQGQRVHYIAQTRLPHAHAGNCPSHKLCLQTASNGFHFR